MHRNQSWSSRPLKPIAPGPIGRNWPTHGDNADWVFIPVDPSFSVSSSGTFGQAEIAACFARALT